MVDLLTVLVIVLLVSMAAITPVIIILLLTIVSNLNSLKEAISKESNDSFGIPPGALGMPMGLPVEFLRRAAAEYSKETSGKPEDNKEVTPTGTYL